MRETMRQFLSLLLVTLLLSPAPLVAQSRVRAGGIPGSGTTTIEGSEVPPPNRPDSTVYPVPPAVQDLHYAVAPTEVYLNWADILPKHIYSPDAAFAVYRKEVGKDADFVALTQQPLQRINSPYEQPAAWPARLGNFHDSFQTTLPLRLQQMITAPVPPAQMRSLDPALRGGPRSELRQPGGIMSVVPQAALAQVQPAPGGNVPLQAQARPEQSGMSPERVFGGQAAPFDSALRSETSGSKTQGKPQTPPAQTSAARSMVAMPGAFTYERFQNVLDRRADRGVLLATFHPPSAVLRAVAFFDTTVEAGKHYFYRVEMITGTPSPGVYRLGDRLYLPPPGVEFPPSGAAPIPAGTHFVIGQTTKEVIAGQVTAPPAPTNLRVEEGVERIYLSWDLVPDSEGYLVYRAEAGFGNFVLITPQPVVPAAQLAEGRLSRSAGYSLTAERSALLQHVITTPPSGAPGPAPRIPLVTREAARTTRLATMGLPSPIAGMAVTAPRAESMAQARVPLELKTVEQRMQLALAQHLVLPSYYHVDTPPDLRKSYVYKVASRDLLGQGNASPASEPHHAHHIPSPPARVRDVTQPTDRGMVRLAWDPVSDPLVESLNVRIAEATPENPNTSRVIANLPASATHYDFVTKEVRHPFQFYVTAVSATHDGTHADESKPSDRVTAVARKLEMPASPVEVTVTPLQSVEQLNSDPNLKVVDVLITWRVKEDDPDLAGFRILKSSTPANPEGLKLFDQYFLAAAQFVQANPGLMMRSVAPQVVVPKSLIAPRPGAAEIAPKGGALRPGAGARPPVTPQLTVIPQAPVALPPGVRARIVQPFHLRPEAVAAPRFEAAKGIFSLVAREIPKEQTIGTVLVDEFAPSGDVMRFNPATRTALTSKFGFKNPVSPMLFFKPVSGLPAVAAPRAMGPGPVPRAPIAPVAPKTLGVTPVTVGPAAQAPPQAGQAAKPAQALAPAAAQPAVAREMLAPQLLRKTAVVSRLNRYQFVDHIPISSRNVQYYRIASYDQGYIESTFSEKVRFTLASYIKPYPPRLVHLELTDDRKVKLTWKGIPETDFAGFNVYRSESRNPGAPREKLNGSPLGFHVASFVDEAPVAGKRSFYLVTTVNTEGLESDPSNLIAVVVPPAPESLSVTNLQASWNATAGGVQLDWEAPAARTDIIGYMVFRDPGPAGAPAPKPSEESLGLAISPMLTTRQFIDASLTTAGKYTYRVVTFTADEGGLPPAAVTVDVSATPSP